MLEKASTAIGPTFKNVIMYFPQSMQNTDSADIIKAKKHIHLYIVAPLVPEQILSLL